MKLFVKMLYIRKTGALFTQLNYFNLFVVFTIFLNKIDQNYGVEYSNSENYYTKSTDNITEHCMQKCPEESRTFILKSEHLDEECDNDCYIERCKFGCKLWKNAIEAPCQDACNISASGSLSAPELYCAMGCQDALSRYFKWLRLEIGKTQAPALVAESLTDTSLALEWETPKILTDLAHGKPFQHQSYLVQWRYEEVAGDWKYCRNQSMGENSTVRVDNLQPYTKYRFRISLILSSTHDEVETSDQSVVISTLASGIPRSPPSIVRAIAVDHTRISVSWEPGPFPNGPILSYVLQIRDLSPDGYSALKDVPASNDSNYFLSGKLEPSTSYTVSVSMRNAEGEGPAALTVVSTLAQPEIKDENQQPTLILATEKSILSQGSDILSDPAKIIYKSEKVIKGVGIHIARKLLFISDVAGFIYKTTFPEYIGGKKTVILSPKTEIKFKPLLLSVDWLNDHLYILGEVEHSADLKVWQISRCDLNGHGLTTAIAGLNWKPSHIEVDPYNGFLFWVVGGNSSNSSDCGLFRLGLADISNGIKHEVEPELLYQAGDLGAFIVDYTQYRILVPLQNSSTMIAISINGKEQENIRQNTQVSRFNSVKSLSYANNLFYWTNGTVILAEIYHEKMNTYFHNVYPDISLDTFVQIFAVLPSAQPIPIPHNPPREFQVLLYSNKGRASWLTPEILGNQGKGAWQEWKYELLVISNDNDIEPRKIREISGNVYTITDLDPSTNYTFYVAAYTSGGTGTYSRGFTASTLKNVIDRSIIWSTDKGLIRTDVIGENLEVLVPWNDLQEYITDITWHDSGIYFIINSTVRVFNYTTGLVTTLQDMESVGSIAVDWLGKHLYWFDADGYIVRSDLNGDDQELLPFFKTQLTELVVDSIRGDLYFSSANSVETCRLNGSHKRVYVIYQLYLGKQVMGLTIDYENEKVYWIILSQDGTRLYRAPLARNWIDTPIIEEITLSDKPLYGALSFFNNRLIWLEDQNTTMISDERGEFFAKIQNSKLTNIRTMTVVDPMVHSMHNVSVIPESIQVRSIKVGGTWKSFNISWSPVQNVNYCDVFYEIKIHIPTINSSNKLIRDIKEDLDVSVLHINHDVVPIPPNTPMNITIMAYTYWGKSNSVHVRVHSPASAPSEPINPRAFVNHFHDPLHNGFSINVTFRWETPAVPNGLILGYKIYCWIKSEKSMTQIHNGLDVPSSHHEFVLWNLNPNMTIIFQVQANTGVGEGKRSTAVEIHTNLENPVPDVLVAKSNELYIVDMDSNKEHEITNAGSLIKFLGHIKREGRIFWIDGNNELFSYDNENQYKLISISSKVLSFTVDWIDRTLYWSQLTKNGSSIFMLNMDRYDNGDRIAEEIVISTGFIKSLQISPISQNLYWTNQRKIDSYLGTIMSYNLKTKLLDNFFKNPGESCSNDTDILVGNSICLDTSHPNEDNLIWYEIKSGIFSTGLVTKLCQNVNLKYNRNMENLVKDNSRLYWTTRNKIHVKNLNENTSHQRNMTGITAIMAFSSQYYPPQVCLYPVQRPQNVEYIVSLLNKTDMTLTLQLPPPESHPGCANFLRNVKYTILYHQFSTGDDRCNSTSCEIFETFESIAQIVNLKPYTNYQFFLGINNYYGQILHFNVDFGAGVVFQTARGAPSTPEVIHYEATSPTEALIQWIEPLSINSDRVWYEVHWQSEHYGNGDGVMNRQQQLVSVANSVGNEISQNLKNLLPNCTYSVWIKAYTSNNTFKDSNVVKITTFSEPENIKLLDKTAYYLRVSWNQPKNISRYVLQYWPINFPSNTSIVYDLIDSNEKLFQRQFDVVGLSPKTQYVFNALLYYPKRSIPYIWPSDSRFMFETLGDCPSSPGKPMLEHVGAGIYKVSWEPARDNGALVEEYSLEARSQISTTSNRVTRSTNTTTLIVPIAEDAVEPIEDFQWLPQFNGTETYWIVNNSVSNKLHSFRVRARNVYGWGKYSTESEPISQAIISKEPNNIIYIGSVVVVGFIFVVILMTTIICCGPCRLNDKKIQNELHFRIPEVELASLRNMPRRANFIQSTNILYSTSPLNESDVATLPQIKRDQISMSDFLGSGAFGEVYEGCVVNVGGEPEIRVAIKTLRKGATDQEKQEFLQEAQLMSNFQHEHILRLIGICLDKDSLYIIMELMQGGDLLSYLRQCRPSTDMPSSLTLLDLVSMCEDVASGCRYLEEMHFIHRDLACRNCLVSSAEPANRVVKIGDFGLARDIYKNDYYRKEGGLLPVRWMSPESLVDGVFTSQSDVWAFGVLCWEIMTLGQQPYPARNNVEVMHYVREGGRLERPPGCPTELYQLMLKCWSYLAEDRPTFQYCLEVLSELKNTTRNSITSGIFNKSYLLAEKNQSAATFKFKTLTLQMSPAQQDGHIPKPEEPTPTQIPNYLELVTSEEEYVDQQQSPVPENSCLDGYEMPNNDLFILNNNNKTNSHDKHRTFSNSSTASDLSICNNNLLNNINNLVVDSKTILVALPPPIIESSKGDLSSNEILLPEHEKFNFKTIHDNNNSNFEGSTVI